MQLVIGNFPPATSKEDVADLIVTQMGASEPLEINIVEGMGVALMALVQYPSDAPHALGDVLVEKLSGHHYKGRELNASVTHNFKE